MCSAHGLLGKHEINTKQRTISRTCSKISCRAHEVTGTHHMLRTIPITILSDLANTELGYNCHIGRMHALKGPHTLRLHPEESASKPAFSSSAHARTCVEGLGA